MNIVISNVQGSCRITDLRNCAWLF